MRMFSKALILAAILPVISAAGAEATILSSAFDGGAEGWTGVSGDLAWQSSGGNPSGYLRQADNDGFDQYLVAPSLYHGDLSAFLGGAISFDGKNINSDAADWGGFGVVTLTNGVQTVSFDLAPDGEPFNDESWHTYAVDLSLANFGPDLAAVLANVTALTVNLEFHDGITEIAGFDNFVLASLPGAATPEPGLLGLFGLGLAGLAASRRRT